jgi:hypothetical protein
MTDEQFIERYIAQRCIADQLKVIPDHLEPWTPADELAVAMVERKRSTVH